MLNSIKAFLSTYETYAKIAVILIYTGFIWYCHGVYDKAKLATIEGQQVIAAQKGEVALVKYQQVVKKIYVKDQCTDVAVPSAMLQQLR